MQGVYLKFFVAERERVHHKLAWEWLLDVAHEEGVAGGSVYRAVAGFGRHGIAHQERFYELGGDLPMLVEFATSADSAQRLLARVRGEGQSFSYMKLAAEFGSTGEPAGQ